MNMEYALAHDDSGIPIDVPANAAGWLVRRHGGGRGRPAAVYDGDGRPLIVPLESTAADLKSHGCKPGSYRLDAVDASRRTLDAVAYTEVGSDIGSDNTDAARLASGSDAAVAALARAVEAMQRVQAERERAQAERERVQAEMISRLVDRLAPPPAESPRNLRDALGEYGDVQKIIRKLAPDEDSAEDATDSLAPITEVVKQAVSLATLYIQQRFGIALPGPEATTQPQAATTSTSAQPTEAAKQVGAVGAVGATSTEVETKLEAVFALLTPDEAKRVHTLTKQMPPAVLEQAMRQLLTMSAEQAAAEIRRLLGRAPTKVAGGGAADTAVEAAS
jgi:hypothetical protein